MLKRLSAAKRNYTGFVPPPITTPFRGYCHGIGPRSVDRIKSTSNAKSTFLVEDLTWAEMQPDNAAGASQPISASAIAKIDAFCEFLDNPLYNYETGRLRILTGRDSPQWAKDLGAGPLTWESTDGNGTIQIPMWFSISDFIDPAYDQLVSKLAVVLSTRSTRVKEVCVAGSTTEYSEPCIKQFTILANRNAAIAAGYTEALDFAALKRCMDIHHKYMTPIGISSSVAYNSWMYIGPGGGSNVSMAKSFELMEYQRSLLGKYCVWQNNSLGAYVHPTTGLIQARGAEYTRMYEYFRDQGALHPNPDMRVATGSQSMTLRKMHNQYDPSRPLPTGQYAVDMKMLTVEMPAEVTTANADPVPGPFPDWSSDAYITSANASTLNSGLSANNAALNRPFVP